MLSTLHEPATDRPADVTIEVWSDVVCPFCYVGKRRLERALASLPDGVTVRVEWKSFELDPQRITRTDASVTALLAEQKGMPMDQMQGLVDHVTAMGRGEGLDFAMDKSVWTNTFQAHVLLHWAKEQGRQHALKERLLAAHFTEGANVDDRATLVRLAGEVGLSEDAAREALDDVGYAEAVRHDAYESRTLGVRGVPFFLVNGEHVISGAQPVDRFEEVLREAWGKGDEPATAPASEGAVCNPEEGCD